MATESSFREQAYDALQRAKDLLKNTDAPSVRYAVLEVRSAVEALVMGQAATLQEEIGEKFLDKWAPRDILRRLGEVDPSASKEIALYVDMGKDGVEDFKLLGSSKPIPIEKLSKPHSALGNFLHAPTLNQMDKHGWFNEEAARKHCAAAIAMAEEALASTLSAVKLGLSSYQFTCARCGEGNHVLNLKEGDPRMYACGKCGAPYSALYQDDKMGLGAYRVQINCANEDCACKTLVWADEIQAASKLLGKEVKPYQWTCEAGHLNRLMLMNTLINPAE